MTIDELRSEAFVCRTFTTIHEEGCKRIAGKLDAAADELVARDAEKYAEVRKDAERYRHLESLAKHRSEIENRDKRVEWMELEFYADGHSTLDSSVDASMANGL